MEPLFSHQLHAAFEHFGILVFLALLAFCSITFVIPAAISLANRLFLAAVAALHRFEANLRVLEAARASRRSAASSIVKVAP